jgi:hypothetical protein
MPAIQQVVRRAGCVHLLLARDRLRQQNITCAVAQFVDHALVEFLDAQQFTGGHIGDLLDRREALLDQHVRDILIHIELGLEHLAQLP